MDNTELNIFRAIENTASQHPASKAILSPNRIALTYEELIMLVRKVIEKLHGFGVKRGDRIGLVLPNGPEAVIAFLACSSIGTCAPLNIDAAKREINWSLVDLKLDFLIVQKNHQTEAVQSALTANTPVLILTPLLERPSGAFSLDCDSACACAVEAQACIAAEQHPALLLHTSGTTSLPKIVPITHKMILKASALIQRDLQLTLQDRCLNVMPLFHVHGLIGAVLTSLLAGASVVCTSGYKEQAFFEWLITFAPTWYTSSPPIHCRIVETGLQLKQLPLQTSLRFIRSASAPLSALTAEKLTQVFGVPVIETYGMTETASQIAGTPLPPAKQKTGSVGRPSVEALKVVGPEGVPLPPFEVGNLFVRGESVFSGYENQPEANCQAFVDGWFCTGDQGYLDADGYLFLAGRQSEIINKGGEKVFPREIDDVLITHPAVIDAVAFPVPHPSLGHNIAAALVIKPDMDISVEEIRHFLADRLTNYKIPGMIFFTKSIPRSASGKVQRRQLADLFLPEIAAQSKQPFIGPRTETEKLVAAIWCKSLGLESIGITEDFFFLGGYSLMAAQIVAELELIYDVQVPISVMFRANTVKKMAELIDKRPVGKLSPIVPIRYGTTFKTIYCVHPVDGELFAYNLLSNYLDPDWAICGIGFGVLYYKMRACGDENASIGYIAEEYVKSILELQPEGPYYLLGYSFGGCLVHEMAHQLREQGREVGLAALLDTRNYHYLSQISWNRRMVVRLRDYARKFKVAPHKTGILYDRYNRMVPITNWPKYFASEIGRLIRQPSSSEVQEPSTVVERITAILTSSKTRHIPGHFKGKITVFRATGCKDEEERYYYSKQDVLGWRGTASEIEMIDVPGDHVTMVHEPNVEVLANCINQILHQL